MELGIQPDVVICRSEQPLGDDIKKKIALFTNVPLEGVIEAVDADTIYAVPLDLRRQRLDDFVLSRLGLEGPAPDLTAWNQIVERIRKPSRGRVRIAVVGKYTELVDSYKSIQESLIHAGVANDVSVEVDWLSSEQFEGDTGGKGLPVDSLTEYDGLLVPGGFGPRGVEGMLETIHWARERKMPFFGICLGLQCAVIEFARNVVGLDQSDSFEFAKESPDPVICLMDSQQNVTTKGGTMRLGEWPAVLQAGSRAASIYGVPEIGERHRHRYEVNNEYREALAEKGLAFSGLSPDGRLVEMIELPDHPWFVACQFHPELKSRPNRPHPLFASFIEACAALRSSGVPTGSEGAVGASGG